ncbi:MAG: CoB--CoM heterodisulfide reductase iron-sulfur subunit A family protein [Candidatus Heimdallarchaeota archaeon]|nr:CoB--CoM heterodisulfide reductase iron-sulfur subunit A family protein [Candidatus Heimdallarchaeota archaeon]MCK4954213.1 CoB--CoM heterodisulfide reductase iron-sulfur subunit A family protein [Candidatus Heimdallarchaeota archaeon]
MKIGVYVCECGINIGATVDVPAVVEKVKNLPEVVVSRYNKYTCSDPGQDSIRKDIEEFKLDRVVVASCSPRMHEPTFRAVVEETGINPYCFEMVNIREHVSWVHKDKEKATLKAVELIAGAVARASFLEPLERKEVDVIPKSMVIGGGISGIQTALEIATDGFQVYLVERSPSIGGRMAQLDKTFPTLDCSACILTPKMVDAARHPNIELLTYSEIEKVDGYIGNFTVTVKKKPRYVDIDKCVGCGLCAEACRLKGRALNEFDENLSKRSSIYVPFPQAVPLKYTIDPERCNMVKLGKCGDTLLCVEACEQKAIDFEQKEEFVEIEVGTIVVATGYDNYDPSEDTKYGYSENKNVITGMEFERIVNAAGPTEGHLEINGKEPKNVVFIQCVGSRDVDGNEYCSRVCCMYTAKQAHMVRDKIPDANISVFFTDVRAYGKGFEEFYVRVQDEDVNYLRRELDDPIEVIGNEEGAIVKAEGHPDIHADLVVLATGLVPRKDNKELARKLNISMSGDGFLLEAHPKLRPIDTFTDGVFIAGCCQSPKDIPDSVAQASGAAVRSAAPLAQGKVVIEAISATMDDDLCSGCRICEKLCDYNALEFDSENKIVTINEVVCKGCGSCAVACPTGAISMKHYSNLQVLAQIGGILSK